MRCPWPPVAGALGLTQVWTSQPPWGSHSSSFFSFLKKNAHIFLKISFLQFFFNLCTQVWNSHHEAHTPPLLCAYLCHSCWGDPLLSSSVFSSVSCFGVLFRDTDYNTDNREPGFMTIFVYLTLNCDTGQHSQFLQCLMIFVGCNALWTYMNSAQPNYFFHMTETF